MTNDKVIKIINGIDISGMKFSERTALNKAVTIIAGKEETDFADKQRQFENVCNKLESMKGLFQSAKKANEEKAETIAHQQREIDELKQEKEFLMQTVNSLNKLINR